MGSLTKAASGLLAIRNRAGLSRSKLGQMVGMSGTTFQTYDSEAYKKDLQPVDLMERVARAVVGMGNPPITREDVMALAGVGTSVAGDQAGSATLKLAEPVRISRSSKQSVDIAVVDFRLSAGAGAHEDRDKIEPHYWQSLNAEWLEGLTHTDPIHLFVALVDGDSMEPLLRTGDQVLVDQSQRDPDINGVYAIRQGNRLQIKRIAVSSFGLVSVISDNAAYPPEVSLRPEDVQVIGRVIWMGRRL